MVKSIIVAAVAALAATACSSSDPCIPSDTVLSEEGREVSVEVVYEANPRFFGEYDCLKRLTSRIPEIAGMGCDILWVMPVFEPGELKGIGSPYCIRDYKAVNSRYGTMEDMKELVNTAHSSGMKVILDWVANHTSWDCRWIDLHPEWYVRDVSGNIVSPNGWSDVAQLDFSNREVWEAMKEAMWFWIDEAGIDGFRCDYADGIPHNFWRDVISELRTTGQDIIMLAETADSAFYADGFDMVYDWKSSPSIAAVFRGGRPSDAIKKGVEALKDVPEGHSILRYVFNHDVAAENDVAAMCGSREGVLATYVLASFLNGTPMVYSSMEASDVSGKLSFFDYKVLDFSSALVRGYGAVNAAFKSTASIRRGELRDYSDSSVACFTRSVAEHNLLVAVNTTGKPTTVKTPISLAGTNMSDMIEGSSIIVPLEIGLEPYGYIILMN